jgi:CRISPR system Cascade subunit CasB
VSEAIAATSRQEAFIEYLEGLKDRDDRAALAALRRSLGSEAGADMDAYKHVYRFNPPEREEVWYCLIAALFALHPASWRDSADGRWGATNFGASLARLWSKRETGRDSLERRFVALLSADDAELPDKLRHAVSLLRSEEIPVNWLQLLRDLRRWDFDTRPAQRAWARAFWGGGGQAGVSQATTDPSPSEDEQGGVAEEENA